ncbi:hypothetical protein KAM341_43320 [Aeromonas caviae]|uniref:Uncharacterized protein n=1 Tax=Aeromonas caviae TaxID=648 RepID=A0AAV4YU80_AERCA|nr:hypothetical protein KAM341_43320 [Aeromonas caviae]GJA43610.1 hypothetical protein KAM343_44060 [Aeromonas caviae]
MIEASISGFHQGQRRFITSVQSGSMAAIDDLSKATTTYFAWQTGATIYAQIDAA